jgi:hypothetical protein
MNFLVCGLHHGQFFVVGRADTGGNFTQYTGHFIMFSVITNICNKKTKGPTLMELFTATGKTKQFF